MPWSTPPLKQVRMMTRDYVLSQLGAAAMIPNSVLRIMSDAMSGLASLNLLYIDWLAKQLLPDTAEKVWLDRHGQIWLVNADGSKGRKAATYANGLVEFDGNAAIACPMGTVLTGPNAIQYQTTAPVTTTPDGTAQVAAVALTAGTIGNLTDGTMMTVTFPIPGITSCVLVGDMTSGVDTETDDQLRERILQRIQNPPMGGSQSDYVTWALAVPGVTRAWAAPEQGIGTITVRFLMDDLRASDDGWPLPSDVTAVFDYIDSKRPVATKDCYVLAPIKYPFSVTFANLDPDTDQAKGEIEEQIDAMLLKRAAPGVTIYAAWINNAAMNAASVNSFSLVTDTDVVMPNLGSMAVLETITYT